MAAGQLTMVQEHCKALAADPVDAANVVPLLLKTLTESSHDVSARQAAL